jgi:hypothetical protein
MESNPSAAIENPMMQPTTCYERFATYCELRYHAIHRNLQKLTVWVVETGKPK